MNLLTDTRGQPVGILRFFATLLLGAPLAYFALQVTDPILSRAGESAAGTDAAMTATWLGEFGTYLVVVFVGISFFGLVVLSLYQREVAR